MFKTSPKKKLLKFLKKELAASALAFEFGEEDGEEGVIVKTEKGDVFISADRFVERNYVYLQKKISAIKSK